LDSGVQHSLRGGIKGGLLSDVDDDQKSQGFEADGAEVELELSLVASANFEGVSVVSMDSVFLVWALDLVGMLNIASSVGLNPKIACRRHASKSLDF